MTRSDLRAKLGTVALFETYVVVDWSAASTPKRGRDSIWSAVRDDEGIDLRNHPTRSGFEEWFSGLLDQRVGPVLVGLDFSLGYPEGSAAAFGLTGAPPWAAMWAALGEMVEDHTDNRNNRFAVAGRLNLVAGSGPGPFWGCPAAAATATLAPTKAPGFPHGRLAEYRTTELAMRAAGHRVFSSWQLLGVGSVGSQSLTGIPMIERIRHRPGLAGRVEIWPFTTGLRSPRPSGREIVIAEVWPGWIPLDPGRHPVRDAAQVLGLADHLARLDRDDRLAPLFGPEVPPEVRDVAETEEGWILGAGR